MTDQDTTTAQLRAGLIELERGVPMSHDLVDRVIASARANPAPPLARHSGRRWAAPVAAAALVVALAAGIVAISTGHRSSPVTRFGDLGPAGGWITYRSSLSGFSVRHPAAWEAYPADFAGSFTDGIVYLSSQPAPPACRTSDGGSDINCGTPAVTLQHGDVFVSWSQSSGFPIGTPPLVNQPGRATSIDGHPAKIAITAPRPQSICSQSDGNRQVDVAIAEPVGGLLVMSACLFGTPSGTKSLTNAVIASARTVRARSLDGTNRPTIGNSDTPPLPRNGRGRVTLVVTAYAAQSSLRGLFSASALPPTLHAQCHAWIVTAPTILGDNQFEIHLSVTTRNLTALRAAVHDQLGGTPSVAHSQADFPRPLSRFHTPTPCSTTTPNSAVTISRAAAQRFARRASGAAADAPTASRLMSGAQFVARFHETRNYSIDESLPVWVVTVKTPIDTDGGPGSGRAGNQYYSIVINARTGRGTDDCVGCRWLPVH